MVLWILLQEGSAKRSGSTSADVFDYTAISEGRLPLPKGTCVNSYGCQGGVIGTSISKCLILDVDGYAEAWQDLEDPGVASELLLKPLQWGRIMKVATGSV
eukprot:303973-Pelagomonas_calceolata.AAC.1